MPVSTKKIIPRRRLRHLEPLRSKTTVADDLQIIPGIGKSIAEDLRSIGIRSVSNLRGKDPEKLYERSNHFAGVRQDPCLLYTFRCAVYFAETKNPKAELLKWWNWKDRKMPKKKR